MEWIKNWFSNMLPLDRPIIYQGIAYHTVENFYQAMKIPKNQLELRKRIAAMNPLQAKKEIRKYSLREDWDDIKLSVMEYALRIKFAKGTTWYDKLKNTGTDEIVEWNNWGDIFWGKDIQTKLGDNNLGKILMKIRDE